MRAELVAVITKELRQTARDRRMLALLVVAGLALWPPDFLRSGAPALFKPWASASAVSPYRIELAPGDIEIARAADQLISATIAGFDGEDVLLKKKGGPDFALQLLALPGPVIQVKREGREADTPVDALLSIDARKLQ